MPKQQTTTTTTVGKQQGTNVQSNPVGTVNKKVASETTIPFNHNDQQSHTNSCIENVPDKQQYSSTSITQTVEKLLQTNNNTAMTPVPAV